MRAICLRGSPGQGPLMDLSIWGASVRLKKYIVRMLIAWHNSFGTRYRLHACSTFRFDLRNDYPSRTKL